MSTTPLAHLPIPNTHPQHKIHNDSGNQRPSQYSRTPPIIKPTKPSSPITLPTTPDSAGPPVEHAERVYHAGHGDEGEE